MRARIFQPAKAATQSGRANCRHWVLEFTQTNKPAIDGLMGWTGLSHTQRQIRMQFANRDEAISYADRKGLDYEVEEPQNRRIRPKSYTDNFIRRV